VNAIALLRAVRRATEKVEGPARAFGEELYAGLLRELDEETAQRARQLGEHLQAAGVVDAPRRALREGR
jgi:ADP-ribose pyrophosphatase YjhB (NUDIX family)